MLGLERLTALGRVGGVRVEVGRLELDQTAFLAAHHDVTPSAYWSRLVVSSTSGVWRGWCDVWRWDGVLCGGGMVWCVKVGWCGMWRWDGVLRWDGVVC